MRLSISRRAQDDLDTIWIYLARKSGSADTATRLVTSIMRTASLLCRAPNLGRSRDSEVRAGLRSILSGDYLIFYRVKAGTVRIVRVLHGKRDISSVFRQQ